MTRPGAPSPTMTPGAAPAPRSASGWSATGPGPGSGTASSPGSAPRVGAAGAAAASGWGAGDALRDPVGPKLKDADFERLGEFVYRRTGIRFTANKRYFVDKRVHAMMAAHGTTDFSTYFAALRLGDEALLQRLVNELTVNETYFLREDYQFDCLIRSLLPQIMKERQTSGAPAEAVRILSLPCSTGEEPYSIALRLLEEWPDIDRMDVTLVAGDIDTRVLDAAREGVYGVRSLQRVPPRWAQKYFEPAGRDGQRIVQDVRDAVSFHQINICDADVMARYRRFDVIFCRNMLIYFDEVSSRLAAENLFGALRPGGYLLLGHSESMSRISPIFTPRRFPEGIVYQRPHPGERR